MTAWQVIPSMKSAAHCVSERADNAVRKYGVTSISLLARRRERRK